MTRGALTTICVLLLAAPATAIDGLAPARKRPATESGAARAAPKPGDSGAAQRNFDWWGFSPSSGAVSRPQPGQAQGEPEEESPDRVSEMGVSRSAEGDEVAAGHVEGEKGPRVHGEAGVYGGAVGGGAYGTTVIEGNKGAVTFSGETYRGRWP